MSFVLRIFFSGLVAFVPSGDGKELTVLLPDTGHGYTASDQSRIESHQALLLARAASCRGDCRSQDSAVAAVVFPDKTPASARDSLAAALVGGGAWELEGTELSFLARGAKLERASPLRIHQGAGPSQEETDFGWVVELNRIVPGSGAVDPGLLRPEPPAGRLAARLRLRAGEVRTHRLVSLEGEILPMRFQTLAGRAAETDYSQALADLVMAEVRIPAGQVKVIARRFGGGRERSMVLVPDDGIVELALLNVPRSHFDPSHTGSGADPFPEPGKHFEIYYDLAEVKPPVRPVPHPMASAPVQKTRRSEDLGSKLLDGLRFGNGRGIYERVICPVAQLLPP